MCGAFLPHRIHLNPAGLGLQRWPFSQQTAKTFTWWKKYTFVRHKLRNLTLSIKVSFREEGGEGGRKSWSQGRDGEEVVGETRGMLESERGQNVRKPSTKEDEEGAGKMQDEDGVMMRAQTGLL